MNIVNKLTLRHLLLNKNRTLMTILGIMLSVAMVCAVAGFVMSFRDMMIRTVISNSGDYHIAYFGVTPETAVSITAEDVFASSYTRENELEGLENVFLRFKEPGRDYWDVALAVGEKYKYDSMQANNELLALEGVIAQDNVMRTFIIIGVIATLIIVAGSVIVIANAFYISSAERVRQFGLLKSVGATKSQIGRSILFEAFILALIAIPFGIILGFLIQSGVLLVTNDLLRELGALNNMDISFHVVFHPVILYVSAAVAAVTLLISAWLPARRAAKTSPIDAIRQTKDIRIRGSKLKTSLLVQILFGFEGTLAAKSLKRSKGKYRATVVALTVSIVLFISVSSLLGGINKGVEMEYGGMDFDVIVRAAGAWEEQTDAAALLESIPKEDIRQYSYMSVFSPVPLSFYTEAMKEYYNMGAKASGEANDHGVKLIAMPDEEFLTYASFSDETLSALLVNHSGTLHSDGKLVEFAPYHFTQGLQLPIGGLITNKGIDVLDKITLVGEMRETPGVVADMFGGGSIILYVPLSQLRQLLTSEELGRHSERASYFLVRTKSPDEFCDSAAGLLPEDGSVNITNISQMTRLNRNIVGIIRLFGYGFIAMLSLIAVTSVISTISTGMALRRQEFAMLYSAGMTPGGMNKMLNLESLLYGLKSLAVGLPIGIGLSLLIHKAMSDTFVFAYEPPIAAMLISVAAVMVLTFGTMRYGKRKLKKISIVEALRCEIA